MTEQQQNEQEIQQQMEWRPTWSNLGLGALGLFTTMGLEGAHNPELALLTGLLSVVATWQGDNAINTFCTRQGRAKLAAKLSRNPQVLAQPKEDGNLTRILPENTTYASFDEEDDDITLPTQKKNDGVFRFSELLASGWRPTINKIFVGRTLDGGKDIFVSAKDLCHVALAGKTGGGKGSLMRLLMVQLCYVGAKVLLLNPHYMKWVVADAGKEFDEDWTPFEGANPRKINRKTGKPRPYLEQPPIDYTANYPSIAEALEWTVQSLLNGRMREGGEGGKVFAPYFIVLDEWPAIAKKVKDGPDQLSELLREGRKFGIFVIVASQDFQVKTIGMDGGSVRKCLLTAFYTGGDKTTCKELLNYEKVENVPENQLGKGIVALRCVGTKNEPILVRVPFVDNESVYKLLGSSTFKKQNKEVVIAEPMIDWNAEEEREPVTQEPKQEATLTREQWMAIQGQLPVRNTDDLPEEPTVLRSPYYEQTGQHLYWQQQTQPYQEMARQTIEAFQPVQIPTQAQEQPTLTRAPQRYQKYQKALNAWNKGNQTVRDMAAALGIAESAAYKLMLEMDKLGLIQMKKRKQR